MYGHAYNTLGIVSITGGPHIHCLIARKATRNSDMVEFSQDLVGELQNHLRDILDLTQTHFKANDHDGTANLRSSAIVTMACLLEIHRTLAACGSAPATTRQHSRSQCRELFSSIALTAQKVIVMNGKYLSNFIVVRINDLYHGVSSSHNCSTTRLKIVTPRISQTSFRL